MTDVLTDGPADAPATLLLAHGAGAPMDSGFMTAIARLIGGLGVRVLRFEFPYMAERRRSGRRAPPPRAETLCDAYREVIASVDRRGGRLLIGGKSMGGRVAAMTAAAPDAACPVDGVVCLGYPFHPVGKPDRLRTGPLEELRVPALVCQGERDPFGSRAEVEGYALPRRIRLHWLADGDHDLRPRKASGHTAAGNLHNAAAVVAEFCLVAKKMPDSD